jgi:hypothetical protein
MASTIQSFRTKGFQVGSECAVCAGISSSFPTPFCLYRLLPSLAVISTALSLHPKIPFLAVKASWQILADTDLLGGNHRASPHPKIPFLTKGRLEYWDLADCDTERDLALFGLLSRIEPERFELPAPFRRSIAQSLDVDASRQAALDSSADQIGSKEGERDGHADMTDAALLADSDLLGVNHRA